MEHQVILLPRENYWTWVRSCTEYVLQYGPNLTQDPQTAAQYMAPAQVITFPVIPGGYPEYSQIDEWFFSQHPGVRLDPISTDTAEGLQEEFALRIADEDRYGQKRKSFYLLWPTDYSFITQEYGANPQIYSRFGMPGHEGVDIRALNNTNIYCCADGVVYRVHNNPDPRVHAYGKHVRVRHKDGYKTVYGHLARPLVQVGQELKAGELLGRANSTGASTGSHLHLTLKRDGATDRGETIYPKDIIDPTPFLIWPAAKKSFEPSCLNHEKCLLGAHARVGEPLQDEDLNLIRLARLEAVKLELDESLDTIERIRGLNPAMFIVVRVTGDFSGEAISTERFFASIENNFGRLYRSGIRYFEIHSNPNVQNSGWRHTRPINRSTYRRKRLLHSVILENRHLSRIRIWHRRTLIIIPLWWLIIPGLNLRHIRLLHSAPHLRLTLPLPLWRNSIMLSMHGWCTYVLLSTFRIILDVLH